MADHHGCAGAVGIFGGAFNPLHNGHLRMAIEVREALDLARVDFVPTHVPPHKPELGLLPFAWRLELVRAAVADVPGLGVSAIEAEIDGLSFSYHTVVKLQAAWPQTRFVFILGSPDFLTLPDWHRGLELPLFTDIIVADRVGLDIRAVDDFLSMHWSWSPIGDDVRQIQDGQRVIFLTIPRLDISASLIREKFLGGRDISGLVPAAVQQKMQAAPDFFQYFWKEII